MFSENSTVFELPKTTTSIFARPNIAALTFERRQLIKVPENGSKPCFESIKSTDEALEIPMVLSLWSPDPDLIAGVKPLHTAFQKPVAALQNKNLMFLDFERSDARIQIPTVINWTRIDLAQKKLNMIPTWTKVVMGVACGMVATVAVHPLDVVKVRLQLIPKKVTALSIFQRIVACEGPSGLYAGLTAGILRQITYTGTRLAVYHSLHASYRDNYGKHPEFHERLRMAVVAGLAGAFMGVPSEVVLVRMIEVRRLRRSRCSPENNACKYVVPQEGAIRELLRIARREGVATWWRGAVPTLVRSIFVTTAQFGVYTEIREAFTTRGDYEFTGPYLHFYSACISSIFSAILSLPVDQVKTRYQSYQERHCHAMAMLKETLRKNGVRYLWKGFLPYYVRQVVHTTITYIMLDQLIDAYVDFQEANKS